MTDLDNLRKHGVAGMVQKSRQDSRRIEEARRKNAGVNTYVPEGGVIVIPPGGTLDGGGGTVVLPPLPQIPLAWDDAFVLPIDGPQEVVLTYVPTPRSCHLYWGGLYQRETINWTRDAKVVSLLGSELKAGDSVTVEYLIESTDEGTAPEPAVPSDARMWWKLDDGSSPVADSTGNGHTGTVSGSASLTGGDVHLTGGQVSTGAAAWLDDLNEFTVILWAKTDGERPTNSWLFGIGQALGDYSFLIGWIPSTNHWNVSCSATGATTLSWESPAFASGEYVMVAVTYDQNVLTGYESVPGGVAAKDTDPSSGSGPLQYASGYSATLSPGYMVWEHHFWSHDVFVIDRAMSADEIQAYYLATGG